MVILHHMFKPIIYVFKIALGPEVRS